MPVRSSLCAYSPAAVGSSAGSASKYSSVLPTTGTLSYGHYKPLGSTTRSSFRSAPGHQHEWSSARPSPSAASSATATATATASASATASVSTPSTPGRNSFSRYSLTGSASSYSPSGSYSSGSPSSALNSYRPLESSAYNSRFASLRRSPGAASRHSSSSSTNSLSSASSAHDSRLYSAYKSAPSSSSSAYSSGGSLSSASSAGPSSYLPRSRRVSYTVSEEAGFGCTRLTGNERGRRGRRAPTLSCSVCLFVCLFFSLAPALLLAGAPSFGAGREPGPTRRPPPLKSSHILTDSTRTEPQCETPPHVP